MNTKELELEKIRQATISCIDYLLRLLHDDSVSQDLQEARLRNIADGLSRLSDKIIDSLKHVTVEGEL
jgi:hypothetical protein